MATTDRSIHVLSVDDDPDYLDLIHTYLDRHSALTVSTVSTVSEALNTLADNPDAFDCIVSDYDMPNQTGIDFLRSVRDQYGDFPFILFTGKGSEAIAADAVQAGVDSYLQKGGPDTYELLANQIEQQVTQHRAETATERYETIIEALGDAVYVTDERGHFVFVNDTFTDLTGYTADELRGEHPSIIKSDESVTAVEENLRQILRGDGPNSATAEIEIHPKDGDPLRCEDHIGVLPSETGEYRGSVGTLRDMSDRIHRERRLRRERNRAQVLFEESPTPIVRIEFENGEPIVKAANTAFEKTFGYLEPEVIDESLDTFIVPDEGDSKATEINRRVSNGETVTTEIERQTVNGPRQFLLQAAAVETDRGQEGYAMYVDITEQHRREQDLHEQVRELEGFSQVMAHDLRNQLNIAKGHLELVETADSDPVTTVDRALDRLDALIGELAEVMRSGSIVDEPTDVDLGAVSEAVWETLGAAQERLDVRKAREIRADEQALKRLLENLMQNSLRHGGPDVSVRVGMLPEGFYVEDDGEGIPEENRAEVFMPGFSTAEDGTGFGLVSVRQIAAGHGWDVQLAESTAGGLRIEFTNVEHR